MTPEQPIESGEAPRRPYPPSWERVAELRVFRTTTERWQRLLRWRTDMRRKGWRLLRVDSAANEVSAVFGRTRDELLTKQKNETKDTSTT